MTAMYLPLPVTNTSDRVFDVVNESETLYLP